ncbi:phage holin family protein [Pseudonocardia sp. MH-G8]|uniref:phage holin family protein n=1 Tax=Pseudonocardia sp. MH-G8 TaxID=1854588 RepID=UPI000B9FB96E|nr:phage holin family protein [Pseudonocardia sp. MH-G8]OZM77236.1 hypothetical protein CFP66_37070 [Pseudonocardia sp. MH-G8]
MTTSRSTTSPGADGPGGSDASSNELLRALTDDVRALVQQELRNAQTELTGKARVAAKGAAMLGGAAVFGALAAGTSAAVLTRMLEKVLPPTMAAAFATALYGGAAGMLAGAGVEELRRALPLVPEQAVDGLRADARAATTGATSTTPTPGTGTAGAGAG